MPDDYLMDMDPLNPWQEPVAKSGALPFQKDPRAMLIERLMYEQMLNPDSGQPLDRMNVMPAHPYFSDPGTSMPEGGFEGMDSMPADPSFLDSYRRNDYLGRQRTEPDPGQVQELLERLRGGEQASLGQKYRNYPFNDRFGQWPEDERQEGIRRLIDEFNQVKRARV